MRGSRAGFEPKVRNTRARVKFDGGGAGAMRLPNLRASISFGGGGSGALAAFQGMQFTGGGGGAFQQRALIQFTGGGSGFLAVDEAEPAYPNGFKHYLEFLIPDDSVLDDARFNNYLACISETFPDLRTVANGGYVEHASGYDMQAELVDGTVIPFSRLSWNATTGAVVLRPRFPTLEVAATRLRLFFGKSVTTDGANEGSAYAAHLMAPNIRTGADRTGLSRTWTPTGITSGSLAGFGATFNGTTGRLVRATPTELNGLNAITVQAIVQLASTSVDQPIFAAGVVGASTFNIFLRFRASDGKLLFTLATTSGSTIVESEDGIIPAIGVPILVAGLWKAGEAPALFADGTFLEPANSPAVLTGTVTIGSGTTDAAIGYNRIASSYFAGQMADVMVSPRKLVEGHLKTQALNYLTPRDFYGVGERNSASQTNLSPVLQPIRATATVGQASEVDPALLAYEGDSGQVKTLETLTGSGGGTSNIVGGRARFTPNAAGEARRIATVRDNGVPVKRSFAPIIWAVEAAPPPPSDKWWLIDTLARDGRHWAAGPGYYQASRNNWVTKCGKWCAVTESIKRRCGTGDQDWEGITGGPNTDSLTNPTIKKSSQVDFSGDINGAFAQTDPDTAFMCVVMAAWPRTLSTEEGSLTGGCAGTVRNGGKTDRRVYNEILAGNRDRDYALLGARLKKKFLSYGWTNLDLLVLRINHECNGTNLYQVFPETLQLYRAAMERAYEKMREGAGHRLRIIQSLERKDIGRIQDWMPQSKNGGIDSCNVSWHPADQISNAAPGFYQRYDTFLTKLNSSSYGVLSGEAANAALGLPNVAPEYSPRFEKTNTANPCPVADIALQQFSKYVRQLGHNQNLIFETIFDQTTLQSTAYQGTDAAGKAAWARMVQQIPDLWRGASKGTVPRLDTAKDAITLSGTGATYNPFPRCTASGTVNISRVVSASGGISATISGSGTGARVEISKNSASPGKKTLVVEMCLADIKHYLTDLEVEVTVT